MQWTFEDFIVLSCRQCSTEARHHWALLFYPHQFWSVHSATLLFVTFSVCTVLCSSTVWWV